MRKTNRRGKRSALAIGAAVGSAGVGLEPLMAATLTVTSLGDTAADDSVVDLREALNCIGTGGVGCTDETVNSGGAFGTSDTVVFQAGLNGNIAVGKQLFINTDVIIDGPGPDVITLDGGGTDRVFELYCLYQNYNFYPLAVSIEGLTITGGNSGPFSGAGISAVCPLTTASLVLDDVVITENQTALSKSKGSGGGISSYNVDLEITGSTISDNDAYLSGGGIAVFRADITLTESTIAGNTTTVAGGGGIFGLYTAMEIARSTISGNIAAGSGGGIQAVEADLYLENSTISGNTAGAGAKSDGHGGGIYVLYSNLYLDHSTIAENTAVRGPALSAVYADVIADHTIFADSTGAIAQRVGTVGAESAAADPDLYLYNVYQNFNWSLIENPGSLTIEGANNITGDPALGALGENGGPTQTQVPGPGSPVLDAGDPAIAGEPPTDQRGQPRIQGAAIEIGAVEEVVQLVSVQEIPTVGGAGLAALGAGLAAAGAAALRRRRRD